VKPELEEVVRVLREAGKATGEVALDALGEALGTRAISADDVDEIMRALEQCGLRVIGPEGGGGEDRLRDVVTTARALVGELGRKPTVAEIAARSGLSADDVRQALALAQVIQR
jgi:uncharacterized protein (DUF433 family)